MQTRARVHDVHEDRVRLACESAATACDACSGGRGCALRWLARPGGGMLEVEMPLLDGRRLLPGDGVVVEIDTLGYGYHPGSAPPAERSR